MPESRSVTPGKRVRAYRPKVTTGCVTCKIRHVKCDEEKPDCHQCRKTGRKCDGYLPLSTKNSKQASPSASEKELLPFVDGSLAATITGTAKEVRAFAFFQQKTVPELCGIFGSAFWDRVILQATHQEPAIKHAAIALAGYHEVYDEGNIPAHGGCRNDFALEQYMRSIRFLVKPEDQKSEKSTEVAMMTCILFVCLEMLRGHYGVAIKHIEAGTKIMSDIITRASKAQPLSNDPLSHARLKTLIIIFSRLEVQVHQIIGHTKFLVDEALEQEESCCYPAMPTSFASLEEARNSIDSLWTTTTRSLEKFHTQLHSVEYPKATAKLSLNLIQSTIATRLNQWSRIFETYIRKNSMNLDETAQLGIHTLKIQKLLVYVYVTLDLEKASWNEMLWDKFHKEFIMINNHAEFVTKLANKVTPGGSEKTKSTFSLESAIIFPLYMVATKCRDGKIRRKAVAILKSAHRQEGLLHSKLTARVAEQLIEIEEEGYGSDLTYENYPNHSRLAGLVIKYDPDGTKAHIQYGRYPNPVNFSEYKTAEEQMQVIGEEILLWGKDM